MYGSQNYVVDTLSVISYFHEVFNVSCIISQKAVNIIHRAISGDSSIKLSIPSTVFLEIWNKWCHCEEDLDKIKYEVYLRIKDMPNIEIKTLDYDVIVDFVRLDTSLVNLERHDRVILASALSLNCPLITTDPKIKRIISKQRLKIRVIS